MLGVIGSCAWDHRANRAQYAEVSFRSAAEIERELSVGVSLPSVQGTNEDEGPGPFPFIFIFIRFGSITNPVPSRTRSPRLPLHNRYNQCIQHSRTTRQRTNHANAPSPRQMANPAQPGHHYSALSSLTPSSLTDSTDRFCSNATSRKNRLKHQRRRPSSCPRSRGRRPGSISLLLPPAQMKERRRRKRTGWRKTGRWRLRANLCGY